MPYDESVGAKEKENRVVFHVVQWSNSGNIPDKSTIQYCKSELRIRLVKYPLKHW